SAGKVWNATTNPYLWETKIEVLRCPSYAGEESVPEFFQDVTQGTSAAGNYIAMSATHINVASKDLATGPPKSGATLTATDNNCEKLAYCGNGALPFPGVTGAGVTKKVTTQGYGFQQM